MTIIIGGHEQGLLDGSASVLKRSDRVGSATLGNGDEVYGNLSNGNLLLQERDALLISQGEDLDLVRTYNSRGQLPAESSEGAHGLQAGWRWSFEVTLEKHEDKFASGGEATGYTVTYGDGSSFRFVLDKASGQWVSTDGAGAFERLREVKSSAKSEDDSVRYILTRGDRTQYQFDEARRLVAVIDRNGVRTEYQYAGKRLTRIVAAGGRAMTLVYEGGRLVKVTDEKNVVLVQYQYEAGRSREAESRGKSAKGAADNNEDAVGKRLIGVTDRAGLTTRYVYNEDGTLARVELPGDVVPKGGQPATSARVWRFKYVDVPVESRGGEGRGQKTQKALSELIDAAGGRTTFDYDFHFSASMAADDRDARFKVRGGGEDDDEKSKFFVGGTTQVVDPLGNARASSNAPEYVAWRQANGYYATYDANAIAKNAALKAQYDAIRAAHTLRYSYDADGYLTEVVDQAGIKTRYTYDLNDNLTSVRTEATQTSAAQPAASTASAPASTSAARVSALTASTAQLSTTSIQFAKNLTYTYDAQGNLASVTDGDGNKSTYSYSATNRLTSMTAALGDALATRDDLVTGDGYYRAKRVSLGFVDAAAASLSPAQQAAIRALYTTSYNYDGQDNLVTRLDPGGDRTDYQYSATGNLIKKIVYLDAADLVSPAKQQVTNYAYDAFGNNVSIVDAQGNTTSKTYDQFGNLLTLTDPKGGVTLNTYDGDNRLTSTRDALGNTTSYAYDAVGNRIGITDANGHTITQIFDLNNRLIATVESAAAGAAQERRTSYTYDVLGNRTAVMDANGNTITYTYDAAKRLIDVATPTVLDATGTAAVYHERYSYDALGNVLTRTDNNGNVTSYSYTAGGLLSSFTDALGNVTQYLYDANRQQVQITLAAQLPAGQRKVIKFDYDEEDQRVSETNALGGVKRKSYDAVGNVVAQTNENNQTTNFEYDRNNHLLKETRPQVTDPVSGQPTRYTLQYQYDANGNQISTTDGNGKTSTITYDKLNRRVMSTDANGIQTVWSYDSRGNVIKLAIGVSASVDANGAISITDASQGNVSTYQYDEFNELIAETDGVGNALASSEAALYQQLRQGLGLASSAAALTAAQKSDLLNAYTKRYSYDKTRNRLSETDHLGNVTNYAYDTLSRLRSTTKTISGQLLATRFDYDGTHNIVKATDALGRTHGYSYDAKGRLASSTDALGVITRFDYDAFGNRITATQAAGTVDQAVNRWSYDLNNRVTQYTDGNGNTNRYEYDAVGNRIKVTDAKGAATQYVYDALSRNIKVIDPLAFETKYEYDGANNRITITDARGGIQRLVYDAGNRYLQTTDAAGNITRLAHDSLGNVITQTTAFGTAQAQVTQFVYDARGNLRQVIDANGKTSSRNYDANANLISTTDASGNTTSYGFDALNRQIRITNALGGVKTFGYDAVGNTLTQTNELGNTTTYAYDAENRVLSQTDALGNRTQYSYDARGNRISLTQAAGTALARTTTYTYGKTNKLVQESNALGQFKTYQYDANDNLTKVVDANGNALATSDDAVSQQRRVALGFATLVANLTQANKDALRARYTTRYGYDANNRVTDITDALGAITRYAYDGNGNRTQVIDARGGIARSYYNAINQVSFATDAANFLTAYEYDAHGNVLKQTRYANVANVSGVLPTVTVSSSDQVTNYTYDKLNRLSSTTDAAGFLKTIAYDNVGNVTQTQQSLSLTDATKLATTRYAYDAANRRTSTLSAAGIQTSYEYDAAGQLVKTTIKERPAVGNPTIDRAFTTTATGSIFVLNDMMSAEGALSTWQLFQNDPAAAGRQITPLLLEQSGSEWKVVGIGTTRTIDASGVQKFDFGLVSGSDQIAGRRFGWKDGSPNGVNNLGVPEFDSLTGRTVIYLGNGKTNVGVGNSYVETSRFNRSYSIQATVADRVQRKSYDAAGRLVSETNALGVVTAYEYDAAGNRTAMIEGAGTSQSRRTETRYDAANRIREVVDAAGTIARTARDAVGNEVEVREAFGTAGERLTSYTHDANNRITQTTDAMGFVHRTTYDAAGNATKKEYAVGRPEARIENYTYDARNALTQVTNALGVVTNYVYDAFRNRTRVTVAPGALESVIHDLRYDKNNRLIAEVDGNGVETQYRYDGAGNQIETIQLAGAYDPVSRAAVTIYQGNPIAGQDRHTLLTYDLDGRVISVIDPMGGVTSYEYDTQGNRTRITDAKGVVTVNSFDAAGRLLRNHVQDFAAGEAGGVVVINQYDIFGNVIRTQRGFADNTDVRQTTYTYDKLDRRTTITEFDRVATLTAATVWPQAFSTQIEYDAFGNQTKVTEGRYLLQVGDVGYDATKGARVRTQTATFTYDKLDRLLSATDGAANRIAYEVDAFGLRTKQTRGDGSTDARSVSYTYDKGGQVLTRTDGEGAVVTFTYDNVNNQISKTVGGSITRYGYDRAGRIITETDPLSTVTEYVYDAFGNGITTTRAKGTTDGRVVRAEFNKNNERTADVDALGNRTSYTLDKLGNRIAQTDALGRVTRMYYNARNQQIATLDAEGYLTALARDSAGNVVQTQVYLNAYSAPSDALTPPTPAVSDPRRTTTSEYDGANNLVRLVKADGISQEYTRDSSAKITTLTTKPSTDAAMVGRTVSLTPRVQRFEYDGAGRLTKFTNVDGVIETYSYDTANNKISQTVTNPTQLATRSTDPVRRTDFTYDKNNRVKSQTVDPGTGTLNLTESLTYDASGNVTKKTDGRGGITTSAYDAAGRVISVTDPLGNKTQFLYDRVGNRTVVIDARGNRTDIEYDKNDRIVRETSPQVSVFTIAGGVALVRPAISTRYDAVGNVVEITDANGFKTTQYYNKNNKRIAEINANNVLRTFTYNGAGEILSATLYMTLLSDTARNSATPPTPPSGEARTVTNEYDAGGRITRLIYPQTQVAKLTGTDTASPTLTTQSLSPDEKKFYDAFGQLVQSTDRNGNNSFAYYDARGRAVATVDEAGFLTETSYDAQNNVVQQRKGRNALDVATVTAKTKPASPADPQTDVVERFYDAANRLVREVSAAIKWRDATQNTANERVTSVFTYDANGNRTSRTLASGTTDAATEYYYYDAGNRLIGFVSPGRTFSLFTYDAAGNRTSQTRYINAVRTGQVLPSDFNSVKSATPGDSNRDETTNYTYDALNRLISETTVMVGTGNNILRTTEYDALGNVTRRTDPDGFQTQIEYDGEGHATGTVNPDGTTVGIIFDAAGNKTLSGLIATTSAIPAQVTNIQSTGATASSAARVFFGPAEEDMEYYVVWSTVSRTVPANTAPDSSYGNRTESRRARLGDDIIHTIGSTSTTAVYFFRVVVKNKYGNLAISKEYKTAANGALGSVVSTSVTGSRVFSQTKADYIVQYRYNALGQLIGSDQDRGLWRTYDLDANGNVLRTRLWGTQAAETSFNQGNTAFAPIDTYTSYDARGRKFAQFDAPINVAGTGATRPVTRYTYDYAGRMLTRLDAGDTVSWKYTYDGAGNLMRETNPLDQSTGYAYDRRGNLVEKIDGNNNRTRWTYDLNGNRLTEVNALGNTTTYAYDAFGRVTTVTDANSNQRRLEYDQADRQIMVTDANGSRWQRYYDKRGNEIWVQDANGNWFGHSYDNMGRISNAYSWQTGRPSSLLAANQAVTNGDANLIVAHTAYDAFGAVLYRVDGAGVYESYTYGTFGILASRRRQNNDKLGVLTDVVYDRFGRITREGAISYEYDSAGNKTKIVAPDTTSEYSYFITGARATEKVTYPSTGNALREQSYTYDALERLSNWKSNMAFTTIQRELNFVYDSAGNLTAVRGKSTDFATYSYNAANQVMRKYSSQTNKSYDYRYDAVGNPLSELQRGGDETRFTYDRANRIISASNTTVTKSWNYDPVGNVILYREGTSSTENNYDSSYNVTLNRVSKDGVTTTSRTTYDRAGKPRFRLVDASNDPNQISYAYTYNGDGQESRIDATQSGSTSASTISTYDAAGRLTGTGLGNRGFIYDGDNRIIQSGSTKYLYANGTPVGIADDPAAGSFMAQGEYEFVKTLSGTTSNATLEPRVSATNPGSTQFYTAVGGETLQMIAARFYGNPNLWFVIADVNGLSGAEALKVGQRVTIPATLQRGQVTADAVPLYRENDIIGSKLPSLTSIPPPEDKCKQITAIILIVVIAIAAVALTVLTAGLAAPALATAVGIAAGTTAATVFGVAATVVIGAVIGFAASAATQATLVGFGLQKQFDWQQVAIDTVIGAFTGLASAFGAIAQAAVKTARAAQQISTTAARLSRVGIVIGETAVDVASEAASQFITDGKIENPWMFIAAGLGTTAGEVVGSLGKRAWRSIKGSDASAKSANVAADPKGKSVTFALFDGSIVSKSSDDLAFASDNAGVAFKAADAVVSKQGGKTNLDMKTVGDYFQGSGKTSALKPITAKATTGNVVSGVQSPSNLDQVANGQVQQVINLANAGQVAGLNKASQVGFVKWKVGKVNKNVTTADDMTNLTYAQLSKQIDLLDAQISAKTQQAQLLSDVDDTLDDVGNFLAELALLKNANGNAASANAQANNALQQAQANAAAGNAAQQLQANAAANAGQGQPTGVDAFPTIAAPLQKTITDFPKIPQPLDNPQEDQLKTLLGQKAADIDNAKGANPDPDYNFIDESQIQDFRNQFEFHLGDLYKYSIDKIKDQIKAFPGDFPSFANVDDKARQAAAIDMLSVRQYTEETSPVHSNGTGLDDSNESLGDYRVENTALRNRDPVRLAELDPYIRLTSAGLRYFPEYQGTVYRGANLPATIVDNYKTGAVVTERAFTSSAIDPTVPLNPNFGANTLFVMNSIDGHDIARVSAVQSEAEVLFRPNTRFYVLGKENFPEGDELFGKTGHKVNQIVYLAQLPT